LDKVLLAVLFVVSFSILVTTQIASAGVSDGTVKSEQKISEVEGGFSGTLSDGERLAIHATKIGDLDNDGVIDLAVTSNADDGGTHRGAVWILFMKTDGTVKDLQKISDTAGGFDGILDNSDFFGQAVGGIGDLDGDGIEDIAAGAVRDDDGGTDNGAVWVLFLNTDGTVKDVSKKVMFLG